MPDQPPAPGTPFRSLFTEAELTIINEYDKADTAQMLGAMPQYLREDHIADEIPTVLTAFTKEEVLKIWADSPDGFVRLTERDKNGIEELYKTNMPFEVAMVIACMTGDEHDQHKIHELWPGAFEIATEIAQRMLVKIFAAGKL